MPPILGEVHDRHAAATNLRRDRVAVGERSPEAIQEIYFGIERHMELRLGISAPVTKIYGSGACLVSAGGVFRAPSVSATERLPL
jgi:hypothetical protein